MKLLIQIHPEDNVGVAPAAIPAGTREDGFVFAEIPAGNDGHAVLLADELVPLGQRDRVVAGRQPYLERTLHVERAVGLDARPEPHADWK